MSYIHDPSLNQEDELRRLNRVLNAIRHSNEALLRGGSEQELLREVCRIITQDCGHPMVWIGYAEDNESKTVRPVAHAGFDDGYIAKLNVTWADDERGRGPTGTAIRERRPDGCADMMTDPRFTPWREDAIQRGYASSMVLPLMAGAKCFGALTIYATEANGFPDDEVRLLSELADDLSFGIRAIRTRAARAEAEKALAQNEERYRSLVDLCPEAIFVHREGRVEFVNPACLALFGAQSPEQLLGKSPLEFFHPDFHEEIRRRIHGALEGTRNYLAERKIVRLDGTLVDVDAVGVAFTDRRGRALQVILRDATERKKAYRSLESAKVELERRVEQRSSELRSSALYARSLLEASLDPLVTISPDGKITDLNRATERVTGVSRDLLVGSDFSGCFTEPNRAEEGYKTVLAEGTVRDYPLTIRSATGSETKVLYNATVYKDGEGKALGVFASARDVTERTASDERRELTRSLLDLFAHKDMEKEYFEAVVKVIRDWVDCQCLGVRVLDGEGRMPYAASVGFDEKFLALENRIPLDDAACLCGRAASGGIDETERPLATAAGSLRFDDTAGFMGRQGPERLKRYRGTCVRWGFMSLALVPIRLQGKALGLIHLADRRARRFSGETVEFLEAMTPLIGEAIRRFHAEAELARHRDHLEEMVRDRTAELQAANSRLKDAEAKLQGERDQLEARVKDRTEDLSAANRTLEAEATQRRVAEEAGKELMWKLSEAQETERGRISRELHDQLGQELTALKLGLRLLKNQVPDAGPAGESLVKLERLAGGLMQEIHRLAWELHPASLDDLGLESALRRYTAEWSQRTGLPLDFHCEGMEGTRLPMALETALYRVTQEALNNVQKHANARKVGVMLDRRSGLVSLVVEDDGAGFEASEEIYKDGAKLGLLGMRERVAHAGGTLEIESKPGAGTALFVRIPLPAPGQDEAPKT